MLWLIHPYFHKSFDIIISALSLSLQLKKKTLEVTVWDYDRSSSNDFLGEVSAFRTQCLKMSNAFSIYFTQHSIYFTQTSPLLIHLIYISLICLLL